jgi:sugar phosphate isomerase/epimerase
MSETLPKDHDDLKKEALHAIKSVIPLLEQTEINLGIENHFDLQATELVEFVESIDSERIGYIFDSTNCIGLIEKPLDVLNMMGKRLFSVHLKDYECRKTDGGYFFPALI